MSGKWYTGKKGRDLTEAIIFEYIRRRLPGMRVRSVSNSPTRHGMEITIRLERYTEGVEVEVPPDSWKSS